MGSNLDDISDVWFERKGKLFGKPQGYCRPCMSAASQGKSAMAARKEKVRLELEAKGTATVSEKIMSFRDEMEQAIRLTPQQALDAESERIRKKYGDPI